MGRRIEISSLATTDAHVRKTFKLILAQYGAIALVIYLVIFFAVLFGAWAAIHLGWRPESVTGNVGAFTAAYLATKVAYPLRIAGTLALTPLVARAYARLTGKPAPQPHAEVPPA